jgi:hypothetical protein
MRGHSRRSYKGNCSRDRSWYLAPSPHTIVTNEEQLDGDQAAPFVLTRSHRFESHRASSVQSSSSMLAWSLTTPHVEPLAPGVVQHLLHALEWRNSISTFPHTCMPPSCTLCIWALTTAGYPCLFYYKTIFLHSTAYSSLNQLGEPGELGEEEPVALCVLAFSFRKLLLGTVFFPYACRENVLVTFIPPSVHHLGYRGIVVEAL